MVSELHREYYSVLDAHKLLADLSLPPWDGRPSVTITDFPSFYVAAADSLASFY